MEDTSFGFRVWGIGYRVGVCGRYRLRVRGGRGGREKGRKGGREGEREKGRDGGRFHVWKSPDEEGLKVMAFSIHKYSDRCPDLPNRHPPKFFGRHTSHGDAYTRVEGGEGRGGRRRE